jgi:hypothetical protein
MLVGIIFCNSIRIVEEAGLRLAPDPRNISSF